MPQIKHCKFLDQSQAQKSYLERTVRRDTNFDLAQSTKGSRNIENRLLKTEISLKGKIVNFGETETFLTTMGHC